MKELFKSGSVVSRDEDQSLFVEESGHHENLGDSLFDEIQGEDISLESTLDRVAATAMDESIQSSATMNDLGENEDFSETALQEGIVESGSEQPTQKRGADCDQQPILQAVLSLESKVEAIVFAAEKPIRAPEILEILLADEEQHSLAEIEAALRYLIKMYQERNGGFVLEHIKGEGFRFQTVLAVSSLMERMFSTRPRPLSRAAFETLAIIAYKQPATRAEIESIRMVDAGSIIKNLMERGLICSKKRKEEAGRPMLFETTDEFLRAFKLRNIRELPPLAAFQPSLEILAQAKKPLEPGDEFEADGLFGAGLEETNIMEDIS